MSLRDEIAALLATHNGTPWDYRVDDPNDVYRLQADALMPLVERAAREAALQMAGLCVAEFAPTIEMPSTMLIERAGAIVARVLRAK